METRPSINYRLLQNFLQVAQASSFRDASGKIHRSTSVVSAQIKQLEQQIGARLFQRTTRSVSLTPEGMLFQEDIVALVPLRFKPARTDTISLRELSRIPTLQLSQATALRSVLQQAARKHAIELTPKYECTQAQTLIAMAHEELGAAILPASIIPARRDRRVRALRIVQPALRRPVGLMTWPQRALSPAAARLAQMCLDRRKF